MRNLSLQIKYNFPKINSTFFCPALFKVALKNFKRMLLLVHRFNGFFRFLNWFFKALLLNWFKNLRAQFGLNRKRAGVQTPWTLPLDAGLLYFLVKFFLIKLKYLHASACLYLNYGTTKQHPKGCKDGGVYQNF